MEIMLGTSLLCAYLLDLIIGDPRWIPHPVIGMGKVITWLERHIRMMYEALVSRGRSATISGRLLGLLFPLVLVSLAFFVPYYLLKGLASVHPWLAFTAEVVMIATTIATKGLAQAGRKIYAALQKGDLGEARFQLSMVVGRDTDRLDEKEISRGTVETVAENIVDAVTSPLFFAMLGGAPLAMAYRAVNTLDSMVGYKNEKYIHLGWASARLDDFCNYIPARITFLFLILSAMFLGKDWRDAWKAGIRDASKHPSPNSGWSEAAVAGALHIQLGGTNTYQGVVSHRALMGMPKEELHPIHIKQTIQLLYATTFCYTLCAFILRGLLLY
ncbi:Adenosylcobinamide-phosphate synthase [Brevibacillus laterosporus]|uniref:Cobalamin biosynthesis protein CobD n=1 Tax=Brevibacillus laterosporus TaxID=1465 RepID=A0A518VAK9_BRELA|nr:adenosylcobinamide-phosphate synthase CbiB [Brevibacillus laterosporus]QDX94009.1 cobalamin biosynthesis protein CobD [Brevibacillus laterosporus]RAP26132.1 Adenosylcobinamide-phosphate synthase [Brevibacillus laterosporus]